MPHLCAAAITRAALWRDPEAAKCAGNGFRDTTRISSGDPDLWTGIVAENRTEILAALTDARDALSDLVAILKNMDDKALRRFLADAKTLREALPDKT
jgi:prephenate dehydrogenase